jgi:hypothetical protein
MATRAHRAVIHRAMRARVVVYSVSRAFTGRRVLSQHDADLQSPTVQRVERMSPRSPMRSLK